MKYQVIFRAKTWYLHTQDHRCYGYLINGPFVRVLSTQFRFFFLNTVAYFLSKIYHSMRHLLRMGLWYIVKNNLHIVHPLKSAFSIFLLAVHLEIRNFSSCVEKCFSTFEEKLRNSAQPRNILSRFTMTFVYKYRAHEITLFLGMENFFYVKTVKCKIA